MMTAQIDLQPTIRILARVRRPPQFAENSEERLFQQNKSVGDIYSSKKTRASQSLPGEPYYYAAFGNCKIAAVVDASATASWPSGAAGGVVLASGTGCGFGKITDAPLAASRCASIDSLA